MKQQKLLMLGTSKASCEMIEYAKSQGIFTIVTDYLQPEDSPAKLIADEYWMISCGDFDALEAKCRAEGVNGIVSGISTFCIPASIFLNFTYIFCLPHKKTPPFHYVYFIPKSIAFAIS